MCDALSLVKPFTAKELVARGIANNATAELMEKYMKWPED